MPIAFGALGEGRLFFDVGAQRSLPHTLKAYSFRLTLRYRLHLKGIAPMSLCSREPNDVR
jgi:hypothetical protein